MPYVSDITFKTINNACVYGFYFNYKDLGLFKDCKFYKPQKTDWLLDLNSHVNNYTMPFDFSYQISNALKQP